MTGFDILGKNFISGTYAIIGHRVCVGGELS